MKRPVARDAQRGQASIEVVAAIPAIALAGLLGMQLLVAGYAVTLADGAAEAGAAALAANRDPKAAVDAALPEWERDHVSVAVRGSTVVVSLRPPAPVEPLARALEVSSSAWVRRPVPR